MSDIQIELEMAIEKAGLNVVDARCLSVNAIGEVTVFMSGQYSANEIQSILDDVKRVQAALARIQR